MSRKTLAQGNQDREARSIDVHVGQKLRQRRELIGASQDQLGEHLGLSFQQIQKYEKGTNRVSAGRLLQVATFLGVRVEYFFEGLPQPPALMQEGAFAGQKRVLEFAKTREGTKWNESYLDAAHPRLRKIAMDVLHLPANLRG